MPRGGASGKELSNTWRGRSLQTYGTEIAAERLREESGKGRELGDRAGACSEMGGATATGGALTSEGTGRAA